LSTKHRWRPEADPHARREARRYTRPIASREHLLALLRERGRPLSIDEIAAELDIGEEGREPLERRLRAMQRDGQIVENRRREYGLLGRMNLVRGRVIAHRDGYGFLVPEEAGTHEGDLFITPREMRALMHGDRIVARVGEVDARGRQQLAVVEVLERNTSHVVGRFFMERGIAFVVPDNKRVHHEILVPPRARGGARDGQIVVVEITEQPTKHSQPVGRVVEVLGDHMAPGMEVDIAIRANDLPTEWPQAAVGEAARLPDGVPPEAAEGRLDLRELPLVTIDGADARDFDDAVYCERRARGWKLVVAIADVSSYVRPGTALDEEARRRGNSVYFPDRVVPMLPEALSNGLCSLNPEVDRLCLACEMLVSTGGRVTRARFHEAIMRSHARLTYDEVAAMVVERAPRARKRLARLVPHLDELHALYGALRRARERRGAIDFDTLETRIVFDAERKVERIEPLERNDAHRLIEECMVAANVAAADFLAGRKMPSLYRVHERPQAAKIEDLRVFLGELGLALGGGASPSAADYAELVARTADRPEAHLIQTVLLRSLAQAVYTPHNAGHFGLALERYTHFTSPIRRYPDLLVHRAIRHVLAGGGAQDFPYDVERLAGFGEHCSMTERRADEATRDALDWLKCEFMLDKVGSVFAGLVTGVTSFGLFVQLDDIYVDGLVHVSGLGNEYFHFDPKRHLLEGESSGVSYRLADRVTVRVARVDLDERKVDFELLGGEQRGRRPRAARAGGPYRGRRSRARGGGR